MLGYETGLVTRLHMNANSHNKYCTITTEELISLHSVWQTDMLAGVRFELNHDSAPQTIGRKIMDEEENKRNKKKKKEKKKRKKNLFFYIVSNLKYSLLCFQ